MKRKVAPPARGGAIFDCRGLGLGGLYYFGALRPPVSCTISALNIDVRNA